MSDDKAVKPTCTRSIPKFESSPFFHMGVVHRHFRNEGHRRLMQHHDITTEMQKAMEMIATFQPISQQKLADALLTERSTMKRLVDNLIKRELIVVTKDENNQKTKLLSLTEFGEETRTSGNVIMQALQAEWLEGLNGDEISTLNSLLNKIAKKVNR
ncbi:MarR family winged helix-turn-helix transcriptional regulator [Thaumasiovibrio subtropicus]|uniref:MarR family winged helix-turn-helix transcriptional regulator n=1 Tax=Thaumasiovibrio subtropicus TaxID=1891207 RepID=UPI000B357051|nr:MarR family winged helix-turn-helix transcriptional regulator [Thaumasiovibrio subtropicus]